MSETRYFHIGDILSITDGHLVSPRHVDGVYDILNWMTGESLFTHQLPRATRECEGDLRRQHPDLAAVTLPDSVERTKEGIYGWLAEQVAIYGETRPVAPLAAGDHTVIDPLAELAMMRARHAGDRGRRSTGGQRMTASDPTPAPGISEERLAEIERNWLPVCGACDAGLPQACTCHGGDPRAPLSELLAEVGRLRQQAKVARIELQTVLDIGEVDGADYAFIAKMIRDLGSSHG